VESNHASKATLILGAGGFLGRKITEQMAELGSTFRSIRGETEYVEDSKGIKVEISSLSKFECLNTINCSSGRLQDLQEASLSNYKFPADILMNVLKLPVSNTWTQIDSYTQYSRGDVHDVNYVTFKNRFNDLLDIQLKSNSSLIVQRISLPHLYGHGDKSERFLPKTFKKILLGENVRILSPQEFLPIIDVDDCTQLILQINSLKIPKERKIMLSISPSEVVTAYDLFLSFKAKTGSQSNLTMGEKIKEVFTEEWIESEQPARFQTLTDRTSRGKTFEKIEIEMREKL